MDQPSDKPKRSCKPPAYEPTPEEIRAECLKIQSEWTEWQREMRMVGPRYDSWSLPEFRVASRLKIDKDARP